MKGLKYDVAYVPKASRLELLIRIFWAIPTYIILIILVIIGSIAWMVHVLYILVLGKRSKFLNEWIFKMMAYYIKWGSYAMLLTDERNPLMPED